MIAHRKVYNQKKADDRGFTLVELIIVVTILAVLVGMLAPQYTKYVEKSRKAADVSNMDKIIKSIQIAAADPEFYTMIIPFYKDEHASYYEIKITKKGMEIAKKDRKNWKATKMVDRGSYEKNLKMYNALNEYYGNEWPTVTMKSTKWGECSSAVNNWNGDIYPNEKKCLFAEIMVTEMGQVSVLRYEPKAFAEAMGTGF